jgi:hypothetical protein
VVMPKTELCEGQGIWSGVQYSTSSIFTIKDIRIYKVQKAIYIIKFIYY